MAAANPDASVLEGWLDALFANSSTAMGVISTFESRYVRANPALAELLGIPLEELLEADPFALGLRITHPDDLVAEQQLFAGLAAGATRSYEMDKRFMRPDGSFRWGHLTLSAVFADEAASPGSAKPIRWALMHVVDITEKKALSDTLSRRDEELRHAQKIDGIGRLSAGIAHDFNNLLTVIIGHGSVLRDQASATATTRSHDKLDDLDAILAAAERAAALTAQLLAHGRRESVALRAFPLSDAVDPLRRLFARTIGSHIEVEQSLLASGSILADPGQIGQIVMNLMLNARDAMPDGGRITLTTRDLSVPPDDKDAVPGPGQWVTLGVVDTGHGMSPEVQARMFEPFFTTRGDRPGTQGTGLGLATVRRIASELSAHVQVKSAPGEGTSITLFFPRVASTPRAPSPPEARRSTPATSTQRVLVVEDEPSVRALVGSVLLGAGYWVAVAKSGDDALRLIDAEAEPFHLVVTDLVMPAVGGKKLAALLEKRGNSPRMLFISGYANVTPAELLPHGHLLPKPFTPTQLVAAVRHALDESRD